MVLTLNEENKDTLEEYIKRADVLAKADYDANYRLIITAKDVRNIPRADVVVVKHGQWIKTPYWDVHRCSCCDKPTNTSKGLHNYCPNCGAKMDGR